MAFGRGGWHHIVSLKARRNGSEHDVGGTKAPEQPGTFGIVAGRCPNLADPCNISVHCGRSLRNTIPCSGIYRHRIAKGAKARMNFAAIAPRPGAACVILRPYLRMLLVKAFLDRRCVPNRKD